MPRSGMTYATAGVDIRKIRRSHRLIAEKLESTFQTRKGRIGQPIFPIGHFAGLIDIGQGQVLSLHVDSVGTKVIIAKMMRKYDTIGIDCIATCANDLICTGSEPIAFLDYLALSKPDHSLVAELADGIVEGAKQAGMAVIGGETAIVPDLLSEAGIDLTGLAAGICKRGDLVLGDHVRNGDALIGVASSGIHSNGLTLARKILLRKHRLRDRPPELDQSIGAELLRPTRIYVRSVRELLRRLEVHGLAHITGGAFAKLDRIVSQAGLGASLERMPQTPGIFNLIQREGRVSRVEMYRTFNMGIGLVVICSEKNSEKAIRIFENHDQKATVIGQVRSKAGVWLSNLQLA